MLVWTGISEFSFFLPSFPLLCRDFQTLTRRLLSWDGHIDSTYWTLLVPLRTLPWSDGTTYPLRAGFEVDLEGEEEEGDELTDDEEGGGGYL